jgi:hypothetical protein
MGVYVKGKDSTRIIIDVLQTLESEISSALETLEIMGDRETLESIKRGIADIKNKRVVSFDEFLKKHGRK